MSDIKNGNGSGDQFLTELETAVRQIIKNRKTKPADRLSAVNAGVRLAAIKHKISNVEPEEGFFK
jgi:hypothetical protein